MMDSNGKISPPEIIKIKVEKPGDFENGVLRGFRRVCQRVIKEKRDEEFKSDNNTLIIHCLQYLIEHVAKTESGKASLMAALSSALGINSLEQPPISSSITITPANTGEFLSAVHKAKENGLTTVPFEGEDVPMAIVDVILEQMEKNGTELPSMPSITKH